MVKHNYKLMLTGLILWLFTSATQADTVARWIKITNDTPEVYLGDILQLEIESTGLRDPIELEVFDKIGTFVRETTGTRIAVINQKVVEIAIRRMEFEPDKLGTHVVGPVQAGDISSNSVFVNVLPAVNTQWLPAEDDLQINVSLSKPEPWIHSRLQLDVELLHRYPLTDETIGLPDLEGFLVRNIYAARRVFTDTSRQQRKTAWRYLLFPRTSGILEIGKVTWSGTLIKSRTERAQFERTRHPLEITVKSAPATNPGWWLPASQLSVIEHWSQPVTALKAGDEITRTITIKSTGILAGQLPEPQILESRALKQTLIDAQREEKIIDSDVQAEARFVYRVKAQSPIPVFLDTVRIPWWNTQTDTSQEAILPARRINVGLPERADLLRDLALGTSTAVALKEWLRDQSLLRWIVTFAGLGAVGGIVASQRHRLCNKLVATFTRRKIKNSLFALNATKDWQSLYQLTRRLSADEKIFNAEKLLTELQQLLFSRTVIHDDSRQDRFAEIIKTIDVRHAPRSQAPDALAPL